MQLVRNRLYKVANIILVKSPDIFAFNLMKCCVAAWITQVTTTIPTTTSASFYYYNFRNYLIPFNATLIILIANIDISTNTATDNVHHKLANAVLPSSLLLQAWPSYGNAKHLKERD